MGELAKGEKVHYTGTQSLVDGRPRVEIDRPVKGWISLKLCAPCEDDAVPESELE